MRLEVPKYVMYGYNSASFVLAMGNWSGRVLSCEVKIFHPQVRLSFTKNESWLLNLCFNTYLTCAIAVVIMTISMT